MSAYIDLGLIGTISENDEVKVASESSDSEEEVQKEKKKKKKMKTDFNNAFSFADQFAKKADPTFTLDEKIEAARKRRKLQEDSEEETKGDNPDEELEQDVDSSDGEFVADTLRTKEKKKKKKRKRKGEPDSDEEQVGEKIQFSERIDTYDRNSSFSDMNISRPLMKALGLLNFEQPTPIQSATIPIALLGRDICACAVTGSGKTAAFMLPILERLLYKPKETSVTRVLVVVPTRELAVQVHAVAKQLANYTNIQITLAAGGLDLKAQEAALRLGPDIVIATPGRLIDHLHNSPSFNLNSVEILDVGRVFRRADEGGNPTLCPYTTDHAVKDLAAVSLDKPVKVFINENTDTALGLRQEFVRIRANREGDREAIVAALLSRTFPDHCIVFIQTKKQAHRMHLRLDALRRFKESEIDILLATDLAARGLDIDGIKTVINFTMPNTVKHYVHRVGRTARAGKSGRSISLVGEQERKLLKEVVKKAKTPLKTRIVPQDVIAKYRERISALEKDIVEIEQAENEEREMRATENQMNKATRILDENQPDQGKRTWFQSHKERLAEKDASKKKKKNKMKSAFDKELTNTGRTAVRQYRAGPSYKERKELGLGGNKKKSGQQKNMKRKR
ncbi:DDX27-like protein [Mya arenaria]|uniref:RNA helicase n=1 Tax=Mya arenaria TaxID=6604 RepID=A0ABY7EV84_MYAAR|nr:DDX27-like protein [Mya arenaria]